MKIVIAFFYLLNGDIVSYTVSDYVAFQEIEDIMEARSCELLISDMQFIESTRAGLKPGESMRASCYTTNDMMELGDPNASVDIQRD